MAFMETKLTVTVWVARCDECGACAGEPHTEKPKARAIAEKRWDFISRGAFMFCGPECAAKRGGSLRATKEEA